MSGWIKLHRELGQKAIWTTSTPEQKVILITLLMMANHKETEWEWMGEKYIVKPGQIITSINSIVSECGQGISQQNVRTALVRFEKYGFLTNESTKQARLITIVNWELYQSIDNDPNKATNKALTNDQQSTNKRLTTNKNEKNDKNINNINNYTHVRAHEGENISGGESKKKQIEDFFEEVWALYPNKKGKGSVSAKTKSKLFALGKGQVVQAITRYVDYVKKENARGFDLQYKHGSTFFNSGYLDYLEPQGEESMQGGVVESKIIDFVPLSSEYAIPSPSSGETDLERARRIHREEKERNERLARQARQRRIESYIAQGYTLEQAEEFESGY